MGPRRVQLLSFFVHTHASSAHAFCSMTRVELSVSVQRGMGVEYPNIDEGFLKGPTPESHLQSRSTTEVTYVLGMVD